MKRNPVNDDADLQRIMGFLRDHVGQTFEEAEIKRQTGVPKDRVRRLVRGVPGIDTGKLDSGVVCYNPTTGST